jgi:hypothetical protein
VERALPEEESVVRGEARGVRLAWIVWYAWTYLGENPFGFKSTCASSWFQAKGKRFEVDLPHVAVQDAEIQLKHFFTEL